MLKKALYIDIPFWGIKDGGANRSSFLWESLSAEYDLDWLEIEREGIISPNGNPPGMQNHFKIKAEIDQRWCQPVIIYRFRKSAKHTFEKILQNSDYSFIFIRFLSPVRLADHASKIYPDLQVIVDVDMLLSRLTRLSWNQNRKFSNRYYLQESIKLELFERKIFRKSYLYLFTNHKERNLVVKKYKLEEANSIEVVPNVMNDEEIISTQPERRILFFGTLTSAANTDALNYIGSEIYPLLEEILEEKGIYFDVAGRGWKPEFEKLFSGKKWLRYRGQVDNIQREIKASLIVFLPLRIASGTRTRILEVANQAVPVITTPIGVEGLELGEGEIIINEKKRELVDSIKALLESKERRGLLGQQLRMKSRSLYLAENVKKKMIDLIEAKREES